MAELKECLRQLHPRLTDFSTVLLLSASFTDYEAPVVAGDRVLVRIGEEFRDRFPDRDDPFHICRNTYAFAYNRRPDKHVCQRFSVHLHNLHAVGWNSGFTHTVTAAIDVESGEIQRFGPKTTRLRMPMASMDCLFELEQLGDIALDDFDIRHALDLLAAKAGGKHLLRGAAEYWPDIEAPLYRRHRHAGDWEIRQWAERELAERLMRHPAGGHGGMAEALVDLALSGGATNLIPFTTDPKTALCFAYFAGGTEPRAVLSIPAAEFRTVAELEYPVADDCLLYPDPGSRHGSRVKAQSLAFVYAAHGYLTKERTGAAERIMLPAAAAPLIPEHTGLRPADLCPDIRSYLDVPVFNAGVMAECTAAVDRSRELLVRQLGAELADFDTLVLLTAGIADYAGPVATGEYALVECGRPDLLAMLLRCGIRFVIDDDEKWLPTVRFILGCNGHDIDATELKKQLAAGTGASLVKATVDLTVKELNNTFRPVGHDVPDLTLAEVAAAVRKSARGLEHV